MIMDGQVSRCHAGLKLAELEMDGLLENYRTLLRMPGLQYASVSGTPYLIEVEFCVSALS